MAVAHIAEYNKINVYSVTDSERINFSKVHFGARYSAKLKLPKYLLK